MILGDDSWKTGDNVYEIPPEIHKALSSTGYTGETMKNENDILLMNNFFGDGKYTGRRDRDSKRKTLFTIKLPKRVNAIQNKTFGEIEIKGQGVKFIIPSNITDIYTMLEV